MGNGIRRYEISTARGSLGAFYYEAIKSHRGIAEDIAHYERLDEGSGGDRSYPYLYNAVDRYLRRARHGQVRRELSGTLSDLRPLASPTAPVKSVNRPRGRGDQNKDKRDDHRRPSARTDTPSSARKNGKKVLDHNQQNSSSSAKSAIICRFYQQGHCKKKRAVQV